jgi:hypothetical protein
MRAPGVPHALLLGNLNHHYATLLNTIAWVAAYRHPLSVN